MRVFFMSELILKINKVDETIHCLFKLFFSCICLKCGL